MNRRLALLVLPLLLAVAGCTGGPADDPAPRPAAAERPSPFRDCAALSTAPTATPPGAATPAAPGSGTTAPDSGVATPATSGAAPGGGQALPELTLPCFTGGAPIALRDVAGPAVINVWASWCPPCQKELPAFQRLSERAAGQLQCSGSTAGTPAARPGPSVRISASASRSRVDQAKPCNASWSGCSSP